MNMIVFSLLVVYSFLLYGEESDKFIAEHSSINDSYIKTTAKNRVHNKIKGASYIKIDNKEDFKNALESGDLEQKVNSNGVTRVYRAIEINSVRLNRRDLKEISKNKDRVLIGSEVDSKTKLMQNISIKNSKIDIDKKLNIGIVSKDNKINGITSYTNINRSTIEGKSKDVKKHNNRGLGLLDDF